jgi:hypothetical protein
MPRVAQIAVGPRALANERRLQIAATGARQDAERLARIQRGRQGPGQIDPGVLQQLLAQPATPGAPDPLPNPNPTLGTNVPPRRRRDQQGRRFDAGGAFTGGAF